MLPAAANTESAAAGKTSMAVIARPAGENFEETLALQEDLVRRKAADRSLPQFLILAEHDHIYTRGRGAAEQPRPEPPYAGVPWLEVSRGGQTTYHGPGQLVAYPIFDLRAARGDVHVFLRLLEETGRSFLAKFGIKGEARPGLTGIWVRKKLEAGGEQWKKIGSVGIAVRKSISYHGLALNIAPDLGYFRAISPCSQDGNVMTSLEDLGAPVPSMEEAGEALTRSFQKVFGLDDSLTARPGWLRGKAPGSPEFVRTRDLVRSRGLHTVCEEARCPNIGECWSHRTATFMIMGDECTRRCRFCAVRDGTLNTLKPLDPDEPRRVAQAIAQLGLRHAVITSVNRDDLIDMGAAHFRRTAEEVSALMASCRLEFLIPDMRGSRDLLREVLASPQLVVLNHNVETVPRLYPRVRPGSAFSRSLNILRWTEEDSPGLLSKSGLMVGLGETKEEVLGVMDALREAEVKILTIGQYLQPSSKQLGVHRWVTPQEFEAYREEALNRGFMHVESGPLVRSSYHAWKHVEGTSGGASTKAPSLTTPQGDVLQAGRLGAE